VLILYLALERSPIFSIALQSKRVYVVIRVRKKHFVFIFSHMVGSARSTVFIFVHNFLSVVCVYSHQHTGQSLVRVRSFSLSGFLSPPNKKSNVFQFYILYFIMFFFIGSDFFSASVCARFFFDVIFVERFRRRLFFVLYMLQIGFMCASNVK